MARSFDSISKDEAGFVRVGGSKYTQGMVLFRLIETPTGPTVHIRLKRNCRQVEERGDPDFYIPWDDFKEEVER